MESVSGEDLFWIFAVVGAIALVLWLQHESEKQGVDTRAWRMFWLVVIVAGAFALYLLLQS